MIVRCLCQVKKEADDGKDKGGNRNSITTALFNAMDARRGAISDSGTLPLAVELASVTLHLFLRYIEGEAGSDEDEDWET